jgi:tetratricopeptide (TPR) repeat protein
MGHMAAGGLWTTASDYATYLVELQKSLHERSNQIISAELTDAMLSPQAAEQYGLGVFLFGEGGQRYFSHIGDGPGYVAGFCSHRTDGFGAVVLTNGRQGIGLVREILRSISRVYGWPEYLPDVRNKVEITSTALDQIAGRYRISFDGVLTAELENGTLFVEAPGIPRLRLFHVAPDTFVCQERSGEIAFIRDEQGRVTQAMFHLSDDVGRLDESVRVAPRMDPGERIPLEMLLAGEVREAISLYLELQKHDVENSDISESRLNTLGYELIHQERHAEAIIVFQLNVALYPHSANCYDSLGEAFLKAGDIDKAIVNYRQSLHLDPQNSNAASILQDIE